MLLTSQEPDLTSHCCQKAWVRELGNDRYVDRTRGLRREERKCSPKTSGSLGKSHMDFFLGHLELYPVLEREWPRVPATSDCQFSHCGKWNCIQSCHYLTKERNLCLLCVKELIFLEVKEKKEAQWILEEVSK